MTNQNKNQTQHRKKSLLLTLRSTDLFNCHIFRDFFESATATTATSRMRWIGLKSSQATDSSGIKEPPMALTELDSSAPIRRPWRETQVNCRTAGTGRLRWQKWVESRRGEAETEGEKEERKTRPGAPWAASKWRSWSSSMAGRGERDCSAVYSWKLRTDSSVLLCFCLRTIFKILNWEGIANEGKTLEPKLDFARVLAVRCTLN